ncbi:hypothetical protein BRADI_2g02867v3 [Brachypodium distachyon]|uniref:Uncharacterized protein n=1 Tax=Brachypodium distachyon TaxID=15368 RepID=A0A2K2D6L7_BRADI|nr:hypothetical protein BRADI_2g02867v3 [Brachypodium distachyon]
MERPEGINGRKRKAGEEKTSRAEKRGGCEGGQAECRGAEQKIAWTQIEQLLLIYQHEYCFCYRMQLSICSNTEKDEDEFYERKELGPEYIVWSLQNVASTTTQGWSI